MEPPLCVVSNWTIRVYTILVWNTIRGSSNLDICFYHCLIFTFILHFKALFNSPSPSPSPSLLLLLLFIIYIVHLPVVQPQSCRVIYYFNTPAFGIRHQLFDRVTDHQWRIQFQNDRLILRDQARYKPVITSHNSALTDEQKPCNLNS